MLKKTITVLLLWFSMFLNITGHAATSVTTLLPSNGATDTGRGLTTCIDGDYILCGAQYDNDNGENAGAAYIFKNINNTWTQTAKLKPSDGAAGKLFGYAVSLDGDYAVVSSLEPLPNTMHAGAVYIFHRSGEPGRKLLK